MTNPSTPADHDPASTAAGTSDSGTSHPADSGRTEEIPSADLTSEQTPLVEHPLAADDTHVLDAGDTTQFSAPSAQAQDPFWSAPADSATSPAADSSHETDSGETTSHAAAAAPVIPAIPATAAGAGWGGTAYPPDGPTGSASRPGPGFWRRVGDAWRRVWASTLGKVLVIGASALAVLALIAAIGMAAFMGGRGHGGSERGAVAACADQGQSQQRQQGQRPGRGDSRDCDTGQQGRGGMGRGQGQGQGQGPWGENEGPNSGMGNGTVPGPIAPPNTGNGRGQGGLGQGDLGQGGVGLGGVLHGEVVVGGATPKTVLYQTGEVTELTAGSSLTVKSTDGFSATYALTPTSIIPTTGLAQGTTVRVIADKDGAKVTRLELVRTATGTL